MGDIKYFYEKDLDKTNLIDFYEKLPKHLRAKLKASLHATIDHGNVLQGYRGPSHMCNGGSGDSATLDSRHGLQEIRFWWAFRKDCNYVPLFGQGAFAWGRTVQKICGEMEWSSLYFNVKTGECLGHVKDEAAEKLNSIGLRLYTEGRYAEAAEYHSNAYQSCSAGYYHEQQFKSDAEKAREKAEE